MNLPKGDSPALHAAESPQGSSPWLLVPAIYLDNVTELRNVVRVSRVTDAIHVQYRWPNQSDYETVRRALLWG